MNVVEAANDFAEQYAAIRTTVESVAVDFMALICERCGRKKASARGNVCEHCRPQNLPKIGKVKSGNRTKPAPPLQS